MIKNFRVLHKNGHVGWKRGQVVGECGQAGGWIFAGSSTLKKHAIFHVLKRGGTNERRISLR